MRNVQRRFLEQVKSFRAKPTFVNTWLLLYLRKINIRLIHFKKIVMLIEFNLTYLRIASTNGSARMADADPVVIASLGNMADARPSKVSSTPYASPYSII
jgi:hypothetical protein